MPARPLCLAPRHPRRDPCRGPRARRHGVVARGRHDADAGLFPRRGTRPGLRVLALPGRALRIARSNRKRGKAVQPKLGSMRRLFA